MAGLKSGDIKPEEMMVPGVVPMLEALRARGVSCYLASGTDEVYVFDEAEALGITPYFAGIYGALDDYQNYSKRSGSPKFGGLSLGIKYIERRLRMRYQELVDLLVLVAGDAGLITYRAEDKLELNELNRSFRLFCVPKGWESPFDIRAQLEFYWSCEQAAYSIYGTEGLCALYHDPDEECTHYELDAEPMIELEIEYHLPDHAVSALSSAADMKYFGQRIREVHRECVDHENLVAVRFESVFYKDRLRVSSAVASHYWVIEGKDLEDPRALVSILSDICHEVHDVLLRLADLFAESRDKGQRGRPKAG